MYPVRVTDAVIDLGFNFSKWTADTLITLINVPFGNDYRDVVRKDSRDDFNTWLDAQPNATITKFSKAKFNQNVQIDASINHAMKYNYLRARNPIDPVGDDVSRDYYYFILGVEYIGPKNTQLTLQLDIWSTFIYDVTFGSCFVERGHVGIANTNQMDQYGRSYLTVPEGLDIGSEYRIIHNTFQRIIDAAGDADTDPGYDILVCSTLDLTQDPGTISDPSITAASGGTWQTLPTGADFYLFPTGYDLRTFMYKYSTKSWITQSIMSITLIPNMTRYYPGYNYGTDLGDGSFHMYKASINGGTIPTQIPKSISNLVNWRNLNFITHILGSRYAGLKKFFTYPYMAIELTAYNGSPVIIKPESWQDPDAKITELSAFMPPGQRIIAYPARYNADAETLSPTQTDFPGPDGYEDDFGDFINTAVTFGDFPGLPIVNDMAAAFLAQNKNGLAFSFQAAEISRQRAVGAGQLAAQNANSEINNTARQAGIANSANQANATLQNNLQSYSGITRGVGAAASADPMGIVQAGANAVISQEGINQGAAIERTARSQAAGSSMLTAAQVRDSNQGFANYSANVDQELAQKGTIAKMQDAMLTQPSVSGQFNGDAFNLVNGMFGYALKWKMPNINALRQVGEYWLRWGYAIHQPMTPPADLHVMSRFTYWKMSNTYIRSAPIPEGFKATIRGILERGVTVWKNPEDIGTYVTDNTPLPGISY